MTMSSTRSALSEARSPSPSSTGILPARFERALAAAADTRKRQLEALPDAETDEVTRAQREALSQVLDEIAAAQRRLAEGTFGSCAGCARSIPVERLEIRPWAASCVTCAGR
jgi:DnaK suppressor protein